jgi:NADH dehydrogenase FAD-containing subunit
VAVQLNIVGNFDDTELKRAQDALARLRSGADEASSGMRAKFGEIGQSAIDLGKKLTTMVTLPLVGLGIYGVKLAGELQDRRQVVFAAGVGGLGFGVEA